MRAKKVTRGYILRFDDGEEIVSTLHTFCEKHFAINATVQAIGAVKQTVFSTFDPTTKQYTDHTIRGNAEITSLFGFITEDEKKKPFLHLHISIATADTLSFGGHLKSAIASPTCEMYINLLEVSITRKKDEKSGLMMLDV